MLGLITPLKHVITLLSVIDQPWPDKCLSEACLLETLTSKIMHWASRFRPKTNSFSFESNSSNGCLSLLDIFPILITAALEDSILSFHRFFNFFWSFSFCRQQIFESFRFVLILFRKFVRALNAKFGLVTRNLSINFIIQVNKIERALVELQVLYFFNTHTIELYSPYKPNILLKNLLYMPRKC